MRSNRWIFVAIAVLFLLPIGCRKKAEEQAPLGRPLRVVATTSIVASVVEEVGKDMIDLKILVPYDGDPHHYVLTPSDLRMVTEADIIFINGLGLEPFIDDMVEQSGTKADVISVSNGIRPRHFREMSDYRRFAEATLEQVDPVNPESGKIQTDPMQTTHGDPHVWTNPYNVMVWVANIQEALGKHDMANVEKYGTNASWYNSKLVDLDGYILLHVGEIPPLSRHLVTDHLFLGYFADQYGFTQVGAILPNGDSISSSSAKRMVQLEELIRRLKVPTIFTGSEINHDVAQRIANDLRIEVRRLYSGSLAESGSRATDYIDYMKYNLEQIIEGLNSRQIKSLDSDRPGALVR
ncbi:MAG TPA: hypothetical protein ENH10_05550 [Bacteroidetes bacterium]|nr:manganese ABC transporter substrate-binding lipoprotein precursor [bacterium BMS3Bbin04]HDO65484.1 hypothetical protein [Bacteroidota bacterium]HEX04609.1 hypothetical protein [Bacteroidota bacterium]